MILHSGSRVPKNPHIEGVLDAICDSRACSLGKEMLSHKKWTMSFSITILTHLSSLQAPILKSQSNHLVNWTKQTKLASIILIIFLPNNGSEGFFSILSPANTTGFLPLRNLNTDQLMLYIISSVRNTQSGFFSEIHLARSDKWLVRVYMVGNPRSALDGRWGDHEGYWHQDERIVN